MVQPYEGVKIRMLSRKIKIKWWKKFNNKLVCKNRIKEWIKHNSRSKDSPALKQDAFFLVEKQQLIASLASTTSKEEFERALQKDTSSKGSDKVSTDNESSQSNPYLCNEDMYY